MVHFRLSRSCFVIVLGLAAALNGAILFGSPSITIPFQDDPKNQFNSNLSESFTDPIPEDDESIFITSTEAFEGLPIPTLPQPSTISANPVIATEINLNDIDTLAGIDAFPPEPPLGFQLVLNEDDRERVYPLEYPWKTIGKLIVRWPNGKITNGTATLIADNHVITAGHVIYNSRRGGWARAALFVPAYDGSLTPTKPYNFSESRKFFAMEGWINGDNTVSSDRWDYDIAIIELDSNDPIGGRAGFMAVGALQPDAIVSKMVNISGYPTRDLPQGLDPELAGRVQFYESNLVKTANEKTLRYIVDTSKGQSGSAIWITNGSNPIIIGIHSSGIVLEQVNQGVLINSERYEIIKNIIE